MQAELVQFREREEDRTGIRYRIRIDVWIFDTVIVIGICTDSLRTNRN